MRKLRIGVIDLVSKGPTRSLYARLMNANVSTIMPQVIAAWCEAEGHEVKFICYTGFEDLLAELPDDADLAFISAFTHAAQTAYALSGLLRSKGTVTALGGPHARCYPEDAQRYFDYVLGFTDKSLIRDVLQDCSQHRPLGVHLTAAQHPRTLPGVRERWKFLETIFPKAGVGKIIPKIIPMIGSLGCPYDCSFCVDATVPYQPLDFEVIKEDLRFLLARFERPWVSWYDPNFGVRFNDYMGVIEEAIPAGSVNFIAESSLSLLSESNTRRLQRNGFKAILPGIESWFDMGHKSKTGRRMGMEKVLHISAQVKMIQRYIPFVQTNFVLGLDADDGPEPFELTKRFLDMTPAAFPAISLLSAFGRGAPQNLEYQRQQRVLGFPFHVLSNVTMNVRPRNYTWPVFYDHVVDLLEHTFSWRAIASRFRATKTAIPRWLGVLRAVSTEGFGRVQYYREVRRSLDTDVHFRAYYEQQTTDLPQVYVDRVRKDLGPLWAFLPPGALEHNPNAYLGSVECGTVQPNQVPMALRPPPAIATAALI